MATPRMTAPNATTRIPLSVLSKPPWPNPNEMSDATKAALRRSMLMVGFAQPMLVRPISTGYEIVDGQHRAEGVSEILASNPPADADAKELKRWEAFKEAHADGAVDCVVRILTDDQARLFQLGFNRLRGDVSLVHAAFSLETLMRSVELDKGDLAITGFDSDEIAALVRSVMDDTDIGGDVGSLPDPDDETDPDPSEGAFVLELRFETRDELKKVKRALRKAAGGGRGANMAVGLKRLIEGA